MNNKNKKISQKIEQALQQKDLIQYEKIFKKYSLSKQRRILEHAQYFKIARILRELRERKDMSQYELAQKMHVKREFISRIESGKQNITLDTLFRIGEATGKEVQLSFK